jgi:restriction system protein
LNDILTGIEQLMKSVLKPVDYEPLPSQPDSPRWRNTAQWERDTMVKEGLLKSNSPRGVWEITEAGRQALAKSAK